MFRALFKVASHVDTVCPSIRELTGGVRGAQVDTDVAKQGMCPVQVSGATIGERGSAGECTARRPSADLFLDVQLTIFAPPPLRGRSQPSGAHEARPPASGVWVCVEVLSSGKPNPGAKAAPASRRRDACPCLNGAVIRTRDVGWRG